LRISSLPKVGRLLLQICQLLVLQKGLCHPECDMVQACGNGKWQGPVTEISAFQVTMENPGKSPFFMEKSTISMAMFNSYV
jgi:hypothetical protein